MGHSGQKTSIPPPRGRNFLLGGRVDLFWNDPIVVHIFIGSVG